MEKKHTKQVSISLALIKSKTGKACACAVVDLGHKDKMLTFNDLDLLELFDLRTSELVKLKEDYQVKIDNEEVK